MAFDFNITTEDNNKENIIDNIIVDSIVSYLSTKYKGSNTIEFDKNSLDKVLSVNNLRNSDYTCTAEINGNKLNIHITDNLVDVPEYIKLFYTYGYKIKNNNEKLRAAVIDL